MIKDQLSELLKRSSEGGGLGLETVKDVKGVLYNARAAKDARLTVAIVQRFVEPQIANATVDPAVFTLVLQVLGDVDELPLAIKLFDVLSSKKGVNLQHVCTLLNAMRQANLRDARDGRDAAQAVSARISQGLDTYYRAALASLPGAEGSVLLAMSTLSLVNTANKELLRTPEGLGWLQQARDIVARLERLDVVNPVVSGHLMVLVAKVGGAQGLAIASINQNPLVAQIVDPESVLEAIEENAKLAGARAWVTNSDATLASGNLLTICANTGSGAASVPVFSDGTNWLIG